MVRCEDCDAEYEHAEELQRESVPELDVDESAEDPGIRIGTGQRDVWRCAGCGKVLGVR